MPENPTTGMRRGRFATPVGCGLVAALAVTQLVCPNMARAQGVKQVKVVDSGPRAARVGEALRPVLTATVLDSEGRPGANVLAAVEVESGEAALEGRTARTKEDGSVSFPDLRVSGPGGALQVAVVAGDTRSTPVVVNVLPGRPAKLILEMQPPPRIVAEAALTRTPRVRVEDAAGNPLGGETVGVRLCPPSKEDSTSAAHDCSGKGDLVGRLFRRTDDGGSVPFDSLAVSGRKGRYFLRFFVNGCESCTIDSRAMTYDPDLLNRNYVAIAAIKSLAGEIPDNEFFDIRFKFRLTTIVTVLASTDLALTSRTSTDSVRSSQSELTEAMAWTGVQLHLRSNRYNDIPERVVLAGPVLKVFNTFPYIGVQMGGMELAGSAFEGSLVSIGVAYGIYQTPFVVHGTTVRPQKFNVIADFFIRSSTVDFFKTLNVRGSFLLPDGPGLPLSSRIAVSVPVGSLTSF